MKIWPRILAKTYSELYWQNTTISVWDSHGNYGAFVSNLRAAHLVDASEPPKWIGGKRSCVILWDILGDRFLEGFKILRTITDLVSQAETCWGKMEILAGNHDNFFLSFLFWLPIYMLHTFDDIDEFLEDCANVVMSCSEKQYQYQWVLELARGLEPPVDPSTIPFEKESILEILRAIFLDRKWILRRLSERWILSKEDLSHYKIVHLEDGHIQTHTDPHPRVFDGLDFYQSIDELNWEFWQAISDFYDITCSDWDTSEINISRAQVNHRMISGLFLDTDNRLILREDGRIKEKFWINWKYDFRDITQQVQEKMRKIKEKYSLTEWTHGHSYAGIPEFICEGVRIRSCDYHYWMHEKYEKNSIKRHTPISHVQWKVHQRFRKTIWDHIE